jgi:hypothetical protein
MERGDQWASDHKILGMEEIIYDAYFDDISIA